MNKTLAELEDGFRGEITVLLLQVNKGVTGSTLSVLSITR